MSEGRRQLLAALQRSSRREIARRAGCFTAMAVSHWASGRCVPSRYDHRAALERVAGIPVASWDEPASAPNETAVYTPCVTMAP